MGIPVGSCAVCASSLSGETVSCPKCEAPQHKSCWEYNGNQCGIYGCGGTTTALIIGTTSVAGSPIKRTEISFSVLMLILVFLADIVGLIAIHGFSIVQPGEMVTSHNSDGVVTNVYNPGDTYPNFCSGLTKIEVANLYRFGHDNSVLFKDGGKATISGYFKYELPVDRYNLEHLLLLYSSMEHIRERLIEPQVREACLVVASGISTWESLGEGRPMLSIQIVREVTERLRLWGITVSHFSIDSIGYPPEVEVVLEAKIRAEREVKAAIETKARAEREVAEAKVALVRLHITEAARVAKTITKAMEQISTAPVGHVDLSPENTVAGNEHAVATLRTDCTRGFRGVKTSMSRSRP